MQHLDAEIIPVSDARTVVEGSDIVCCATNTTTPVLKGEWLCNGQMVISIVNSDPTATRREVDNETFIRASDIVINDWDSVYSNKQIELIEPLEAGLVKKRECSRFGRNIRRARPSKIRPRQHYLLQKQHRPRHAVCGSRRAYPK